jgi:hypothetical protein
VQLRPGAKFCSSCGAVHADSIASAPALAPLEPPTAAPSAVGTASAASITTAATVTATATATATAATVAETAQKLLIPSFPGRLLWSPRRRWRVTTRLSPSEIADIFESRMTKSTNLVSRMNSYFRHARWDIRRGAMSDETVAMCVPTGRVTTGFGHSKIEVDVSGDTLVVQTSRTAHNLTEASIGPGVFTTLWGLYLYPATVYPHDVVKAIKRADRDAVVAYPWSIARMGGLAVILVAIVAATVGVGGGGSSPSLSSSGQPDSGGQLSPPLPPDPTPPDPDADTTTTGDDGDDPAPARAFTSADGYVVVPPQGWIRDSDSNSKGTFTESRWHLAGAPGVYVLVNRTAGYEGSAQDGASGVRGAAQQADDYEEIGWRELAPSGWYWEFNFSGSHKIDVFTKACGDGYAALGAAPTGQFETHRDMIVAFIESLAAPCGDSMPSISGNPGSTGEPETKTTPATATQTTPDTQTTPGTPTYTVTPEPARNSPMRILRRHFQRLSSGDYDAAYRLLSSGYRHSNPSWTQQPSEAEPLVKVVAIGPSRISGGQARVPITFYARDRNPTSRSDTKCRQFSGKAKLVKEGSAWRYDPTSNRYDVAVVDSASPECNP